MRPDQNQEHSIGQDVRHLLGGPSLESTVRSILDQTVLPDGRFEAHEFGRNQHSSASAGACLIGICGIPKVADETVAPLVHAAAALIDEQGNARWHDDDPTAPVATWALSQLLLGLLTRPHLAATHEVTLRRLRSRLISLQDEESGGWPLRIREEPGQAFTFYPVVGLVRSAAALGWSDELRESLRSAGRYLAACLESDLGSLEERILSTRALSILQSTLDGGVDARLTELLSHLADTVWDGNGLRLEDRTILAYRQPIWHVTLWRPLLYSVLRSVMTPEHPASALVGHELVASYDRDLMAWRGPVAAGSRNGVSWASALAIRSVYVLARDLRHSDLAVSDWLNRCRDLASGAFEHDVAISFAGADRTVAESISKIVKQAGYRVFYDRDYQHVLLGEDLATYLQEVYFRKSRFAIVVVSRAFLDSRWAGNWEWRAVLARMQSQHAGYVLPYLLEDVVVPGLNPTIGYVSHRDYAPQDFAALVIRKLRSGRTV